MTDDLGTQDFNFAFFICGGIMCSLLVLVSFWWTTEVKDDD